MPCLEVRRGVTDLQSYHHHNRHQLATRFRTNSINSQELVSSLAVDPMEFSCSFTCGTRSVLALCRWRQTSFLLFAIELTVFI
jgi:hypothetical protein